MMFFQWMEILVRHSLHGLVAAASRSKFTLSARPAPVRRARPLMPSLAPSPWNMKKAQLLAELNERGVVVHTSWTVPELRQILIEQRDLEKPPSAVNDKMKGLTSLKLQELVDLAEKEGISLPTKPTRGL